MQSGRRQYLRERFNVLARQRRRIANMQTQSEVKKVYDHSCSCGNSWTADRQEATCPSSCRGLLITVKERIVFVENEKSNPQL